MKKILVFLAMILFSLNSFAQLDIVNRYDYPYYQYHTTYVDKVTFYSSESGRVYLTFATDFYSKTFDVTSFSEQVAITLSDVQDIIDTNGGRVYVTLIGYKEVFALNALSFRRTAQYVYVYNTYGTRYMYNFYRPYIGYMRPYRHHYHRPIGGYHHTPHHKPHPAPHKPSHRSAHHPEHQPAHHPEHRPADKPHSQPSHVSPTHGPSNRPGSNGHSMHQSSRPSGSGVSRSAGPARSSGMSHSSPSHSSSSRSAGPSRSGGGSSSHRR